jgi:hypothetical protein
MIYFLGILSVVLALLCTALIYVLVSEYRSAQKAYSKMRDAMKICQASEQFHSEHPGMKSRGELAIRSAVYTLNSAFNAALGNDALCGENLPHHYIQRFWGYLGQVAQESSNYLKNEMQRCQAKLDIDSLKARIQKLRDRQINSPFLETGQTYLDRAISDFTQNCSCQAFWYVTDKFRELTELANNAIGEAEKANPPTPLGLHK